MLGLVLALVIQAGAQAQGGPKGLMSSGIGWDARAHALTDSIVLLDIGVASQEKFVPGTFVKTLMVAQEQWPGPQSFVPKPSVGSGPGFQTANMEVRIGTGAFSCVTLFRTGESDPLTTVCIDRLQDAWKNLSFDRKRFTNVYGLGQNFRRLGTADGDQVAQGQFESNDVFGNSFPAFNGGADSIVQFPMGYFLGEKDTMLGVFIDSGRKVTWNFNEPTHWKTWSQTDRFRVYLIFGKTLLSLRQQYFSIVGQPVIPPKKLFGMWISQFGFKNWKQVDDQLAVTRKGNFPIDGFLLDLQWFGGVQANSPDSAMGGLKWDESNFPTPAQKIAQYYKDNIGFVTIEESYVSVNQRSYKALDQFGGMVKYCDNPTNVVFNDWFGRCGMIDWTNEKAGAWFHDNLRSPNLAQAGIVGHWTDLGEPEKYHPNACYQGGVLKHQTRVGQVDAHNLYNLAWLDSISKGYIRDHKNGKNTRRPMMMSRSGAPGMHRYGAGMWSGDIAGRLDVLSTYLNVHMHMTFAGLDYYCSDGAGFWRRALKDDTAGRPNEDEMYTKWIANSAWFDFPLKPHPYNCGFEWLGDPGCPFRISPATIGDIRSNLHSIRQRYELVPFYYSLAFQNYRSGTPLVWPVVMKFTGEREARQMGHQKLVGGRIMVGVVSSYGQRTRDLWLPTGLWYNYHNGGAIDQKVSGNVPSLDLWPGGVFKLPAYAMAGSIIPTQIVDDGSKDVFNNLISGGRRDDLVIKVFTSTTADNFLFYEDDGETVTSYTASGTPVYKGRTTQMSQKLTIASDVKFTFDFVPEAVTGIPNVPDNRPIHLRVWFPRNVVVDQVTLVTGSRTQNLSKQTGVEAPNSDLAWSKSSDQQTAALMIRLGTRSSTEAFKLNVSGKVSS